METNPNFGMYLRLQRELIDAYVEPICDHDRIQRLTDDLAVARRAAERNRTVDEQSSDSTVPGVAS